MYTPGPWKVGSYIPKLNKFYILAKDQTAKYDREMQVVVLDRGEHPTKEYADRALADAKLIAAAPELLETLIEITKMPKGWEEDSYAMAEVAQEAINKATK